MSRTMKLPCWLPAMGLVALMWTAAPAWSQEAQPAAPPPAANDAPPPANADNAAPPADAPPRSLEEQAGDTLNVIKEQGDKLARDVDQSPQAQELTIALLQPIYQAAEFLEFPAFHWVAFALMVAGVIGYALQLVLGKLVVLSRMGFSYTEILSDALGLVISVVGLILTTQAAAQNSDFTRRPAAVLSSAIFGAVLGLLLYVWGQRSELQAVTGRKVEAARDAKLAKK